MKRGDLIKYVCEDESGERCHRCTFCTPHALFGFDDIPTKNSNRIGVVLSQGPDGSWWCQFDFGKWDVWPNEVVVLNESR